MGFHMANNLMKAGFQLVVHDMQVRKLSPLIFIYQPIRYFS